MSKKSSLKMLFKIFIIFLKISPVTFGGGYAMIPMLEKAVTERNKWIKKEDIADVLAVSQSVPGSIAVNSATFVGYRLAGIPGAITATLGVILPTFFIIIMLAVLFIGYQDYPIVQAAFKGIRPAVVALILFAAVKIGKTALLDKKTVIVASSALILLFISVSPIVVLITGAVAGIVLKSSRKKNKPDDTGEDAVEDR